MCPRVVYILYCTLLYVHVAGTLDSVLIKEVSVIISGVHVLNYRGVPLYILQPLIFARCLQFSTPSFTTPGQPPYLPMTVITYDITTIDGKNHEVKLYYDNTAEVCMYVRMLYAPGQQVFHYTILILWPL